MTQAQNAESVIPPKRNRKEQRAYDKTLYKERNLIERLFQATRQELYGHVVLSFCGDLA